ncbi:serine phosphatase RsbU (regulator of sigma subunit) [Jatrophihabitans sp. GAS493]|uniref:PP2C family protein-serine/threonine phosphatase n=1 Tax=Jatrophihabitans sp. GAS493 TaxID=1907575 RepID=UPI000BB9B616|nr:SpoIIE family protein phosphatase [Jatrophihabitans sp. GAS493]SOD72205.1 serine phosphatase RsbU (regulator of sigma subunit) [Jatrophihabitans sp. GAS493]
MSVKRLVVSVLTAVVALFALAGVLVAVQAVAVHRSQQRLQTVWDPAALVSRQLLGDYVNQETGERGYLITGDPTFLQPYTDGLAAARTDTAKLAKLLVGSAIAELDAVRAAGGDWAAASAPELDARRDGDDARADRLVAAGAGKAAFDALRMRLEHLQASVDAARSSEQRTEANATAALAMTLFAAGALAVLAVLVLSVGAFRGIITPLAALGARLHLVSDGAVHSVITASGPTEIRELGRDAEAMRAHLVAQIDNAQRATEGLVQQAPVVVELRQALQPSPVPTSERGLQIAGEMVPAEGEIAGDWWDTIRHPDGRVTLLLADVSGHGPAAALLAVALKAVLRAGVRTGQNSAELLDRPARDVFTAQPAMFATAVIIEFDPTANQLHWANAGHPPPLLLTADGQVHQLDPTGPLINPVTSGTTRRTIAFGPGDSLLAYSDGLIESPDQHDVTLSEAALVQAVRGTTSAPQVVDVVLALLESHTGSHRHRDDITVVSAYRSPELQQPAPMAPPTAVVAQGWEPRRS